MTSTKYPVQMAVASPHTNNLLTYFIDETQVSEKGTIFEVPLGRRTAKAVFIDYIATEKWQELSAEYSAKKIQIKNAISKNDFYQFSQYELDLFQWVAQYYHYSLGQLIFDCFPGQLKESKKKLTSYQGEGKDFPFALNEQQKEIINNITNTLHFGFSKHYLWGVTGSGKTAVYVELIKNQLSLGKTVFILVPEINLTPQLLTTIQSFVNVPIFLYHSGISANEKALIWKHFASDNTAKVVLGARSAVFLPSPNLGLIIIDEEHDHSYKQEDRCPYNARDVAIKRASMQNIPILLGSATPTVENYYNFFAEKKKNHFGHRLRERVQNSSLPQVVCIDLKGNKGQYWPFADFTLHEIKDHLAKNEQVLILVNKLGFARFLQCKSCGLHFKCKNCSSRLRLFLKRRTLECQFCNFVMPVPQGCPQCQCLDIMQLGFGTEKIEQVLKQFFPDKRVARFDRDEIKTEKQLKKSLDQFHAHDIDILVGTQMISKGHNFHKVNLVVILGVDSNLNVPDFRNQEKLFQLLAQVSGRAGRYSTEGKVLVETLDPSNSLFSYLQKEDAEEFYINELSARQLLFFPPYSKLAAFYVYEKDQAKLAQQLSKIKSFLNDVMKKNYSDVHFSGPRPTLIEKKKNTYSWVFIFRSSNIKQMHSLLRALKIEFASNSSFTSKVDIDAMSIL